MLRRPPRSTRTATLLPYRRSSDLCNNSYWTVGMRYERSDVAWQDFRHKYVAFGGDGIYACWALLYHETLVTSGAWKKRCPPLSDGLAFPAWGLCPNAEAVKPKVMQFVTRSDTRRVGKEGGRTN